MTASKDPTYSKAAANFENRTKRRCRIGKVRDKQFTCHIDGQIVEQHKWKLNEEERGLRWLQGFVPSMGKSASGE